MIELYNTTNLTGTTTFTITPDPGYGIAASQFPTIAATSYYSSITFADTTEPYRLDNSVIGTITWIEQSIFSDLNLTALDLSSVIPIVLPRQYNSIIDVYHDKNSDVDLTNYFTRINFSYNATWDDTTLSGTFTGNAGLTYMGSSGLWPSNSENNNVFTLEYTITNSNFVTGDVFLANWGDSITATYIPLDFSNGTHTVDVTVDKTSGRKNAIYFYCNNKSGKSADFEAVSLTRKTQDKEVVSFLNVNSNLTISDDLLPSSTIKSRFSISGTFDGLQDNELYTIKLSSYNGHYYGTSAFPQIILNDECLNNDHSIGTDIKLKNENNQIIAKETTVNWYSENNIEFSNNCNVSFGLGTILKDPEAYFQEKYFIVNDSAGSFSQVYFRSSTATNSVTTSDAWITIPATVSTYFPDSGDAANLGFGNLNITLSQNTTGSLRTGRIDINNSYNSGSPDDTIDIIQAPAGDWINIYNLSPTESVSAGSADYPIISPANQDDYINIEVKFASNVSDIDISDLAIAIATGDAGWLSLPNSIDAGSLYQNSTLVPGVYVYTATLQATITDASLTSRGAKIRINHSSAAIYDEVVFTQNIFDPATDTIVTSIPGGSTFSTSPNTATLRITSSTTGSPTPVVVLEPAKAWPDPNLSNNNINNVIGDYEIVENFVTLGEVEVVTGEPYTHQVAITIDGFTGADNNDLRTQRIKVYHVNDLAQTTPKGQNIAQSYIYNVDTE